jgi:SAM-dependent methyltransferase
VSDPIAGSRATPRTVIARALPRSVKRLLKRTIPSLQPTHAAHRVAADGEPATAHIPSDHARQVHARYYIKELMTGADAPALVVDLGCGDGGSAAWFRRWQPDVEWIGVDIEQSDLAKKIQGEKVILYDGVNLPFPDDSVPLIYSSQVFEHVRYPEPLLAEIRRVLIPGGLFIGSTSQMEPYHARSLWGGYTIYGWRTLCAAAGLVLEEARPSIDAIALITRGYSGPPAEYNPWDSSPLNEEIDRWAAETGADVLSTNARKLRFAGQFAFRVRKPAAGARPVSSGAPVRSTSPVSRLGRRVGDVLVRVGLRLSR